VEPVPDPLLPRKSSSAGNRTRSSGYVARNSDHWTTEAVKTWEAGTETSLNSTWLNSVTIQKLLPFKNNIFKENITAEISRYIHIGITILLAFWAVSPCDLNTNIPEEPAILVFFA
jgi:hypothetical protein